MEREDGILQTVRHHHISHYNQHHAIMIIFLITKYSLVTPQHKWRSGYSLSRKLRSVAEKEEQIGRRERELFTDGFIINIHLFHYQNNKKYMRLLIDYYDD